MKNYLHTLDEIIYKGLRPWLSENNPDEKFAPMLSGVQEVNLSCQAKYHINFERPFNNKTKYYSKFINAQKINAINQLLNLLQEDENPQLIKSKQELRM